MSYILHVFVKDNPPYTERIDVWEAADSRANELINSSAWRVLATSQKGQPLQTYYSEEFRAIYMKDG